MNTKPTQTLAELRKAAYAAHAAHEYDKATDPVYRTTTYVIEVKNELGEMKRLGIRVPLRAFAMAGDEKEMAEYADNGMSVSDCADLLVSLAKTGN